MEKYCRSFSVFGRLERGRRLAEATHAEARCWNDASSPVLWQHFIPEDPVGPEPILLSKSELITLGFSG